MSGDRHPVAGRLAAPRFRRGPGEIPAGVRPRFTSPTRPCFFPPRDPPPSLEGFLSSRNSAPVARPEEPHRARCRAQALAGTIFSPPGWLSAAPSPSVGRSQPASALAHFSGSPAPGAFAPSPAAGVRALHERARISASPSVSCSGLLPTPTLSRGTWWRPGSALRVAVGRERRGGENRGSARGKGGRQGVCGPGGALRGPLYRGRLGSPAPPAPGPPDRRSGSAARPPPPALPPIGPDTCRSARGPGALGRPQGRLRSEVLAGRDRTPGREVRGGGGTGTAGRSRPAPAAESRTAGAGLGAPGAGGARAPGGRALWVSNFASPVSLRGSPEPPEVRAFAVGVGRVSLSLPRGFGDRGPRGPSASVPAAGASGQLPRAGCPPPGCLAPGRAARPRRQAWFRPPRSRSRPGRGKEAHSSRGAFEGTER